MRPYLRTFLLFSVLELATLVFAAFVLGPIISLGLLVISLFYGLLLVRERVGEVSQRLQRRSAVGLPEPEILAEGASSLLAGLLFIFPGFLSDLAALAILWIPAVQRRVQAALTTLFTEKFGEMPIPAQPTPSATGPSASARSSGPFQHPVR